MEKINIAKKLKHCKKGIKLYHLMFGEVEFYSITDNNKIVILISDINDSKETYFVEYDGTYYSNYPNGECLLFPSKYNRDWNTFQLLEEGHRVMVSDTGDLWSLQEYYKDNQVKYLCSNDFICWKYIVPIEDFDFTAEDITINKERSIV